MGAGVNSGNKKMNKDDLIGIFRTSHNNCKLVYASMVLFGHDDMAPFYQKWSSSLDIPTPYDEKGLLALLHDRDVLKHAFAQLFDTVHRAALKEMFEVTKKYCDETNQLKLLQSQNWYQFWRILRNCVSHDFKFHFGDHDRKKLPVSWGDVTITESMEGEFLTHGVLSRENILNFLEEVKSFIDENMT